MRRRTGLALTVAAGLSAATAGAQEAAPASDMVPIARAVEAEGAAPLLPLARCVAFYVAGADLLQAQMTEDLRIQVTMIVGALAMRGVQEGQAAGLTPAAARLAMTDAIAPHVPAYRDRFAANAARDGRAFAGDPLWEADSAFCEALVRAGAAGAGDQPEAPAPDAAAPSASPVGD